MSIGSANTWDGSEGNSLLWLATSALALVAHLALLQFGITAYQSQISKTAEPALETKIFASALQITGIETPPQLEVEQLTTTPAEAQAPSIQPIQPASQTLSAVVAEAPVAEAVESVAPTAATPTPAVPANQLLPTTASPPPDTLPLSQPGVAPLAVAPVQSTPAAQASVVNDDETLKIATLDAPTVTGTELVPEPAPILQPEPAPLPDLANSLPPPPNSITEDQSGVASAIVPTQTTEQAQETYDTVLSFLRGFDGGPCFAALPVLAEDGAFRFETFAQSHGDLNRFRDALEISTGTLPGTVMKPVSDAQCQALPFVTGAARYPEFQLYLDLDVRDIPSGEHLSGKLGNTSGGFVSLFLIDDEGVVQDLGSFLKFRAGYAGFDIPMTLKGSPVETHQLLMALSTRAQLKTLKSLSGQPAKDFFQRLAVEILLQGGGEDVALVAFSVR